MRSSKLNNVRRHFRDAAASGGGGDSGKQATKILLGKTKLLQVALGRTPEEEYRDNLRHVSKLIAGSVGIVFTSLPQKEIESFFAGYRERDYARAGSVAGRTVEVSDDDMSHLPVSMMEQFRALGMPVEIKDGRIGLVNGRNSNEKKKYTVCKRGQTLSAEQCKLLVHFGIQLSVFRVRLLCHWSDGEFDVFDGPDEDGDEDELIAVE